MEKQVEIYRMKSTVLNDAVSRTVVAINTKKKRYGYKVFGLCGSEPMVGTTTMTIDIAIAAASIGERVLLVDGNFNKEESCKRLCDNTSKGLLDYISGVCSAQDMIYETSIKNLTFIPSGRMQDFSMELLCSEAMDNFMSKIKDSFDMIFFDMPAVNTSVEMLVLMEKMDAVMVVSSTNADRETLAQCKAIFAKQNVNYLGIVANKIERKEYDSFMKNYDYFNEKKYLKNNKR